MVSDRGRLSSAAVELLQTFAPRLGDKFHPLVNVYVPPLIRLLARPNKVFIKRASKCLETIISHCQLPILIVHLRNALDDRSDQCKRSSAAAIQQAVDQWEVNVWHDKDMATLEFCVQKMAKDKDAEVRKTGKTLWAVFQEIWPERVAE